MEPLTLTLAAGQTVVRATDTGQSGGNVDYLGISPGVASTVPTQTATFRPADLGVRGRAVVYDWFAGTGTVVPSGGTFSATVTSGSYYVVVPVSSAGIAFPGDAGKFASLGRKRISGLQRRGGGVEATVEFADGEGPVTLHGYAQSHPHVSGSAAGEVSWDAATSLWQVAVSPQDGSSAKVTATPA